MKINSILLAFILLTWVAFRSLIAPGVIVPSITNNLILVKGDCANAGQLCVEVDLAGFSSAINNVTEDCSGGVFGFADCVESIVKILVQFVKLILSIALAVIAFVIDVFLLAALFLLVGFSPIDGAPVIINFVVVGLFTIMLLLTVVSFIPGED